MLDFIKQTGFMRKVIVKNITLFAYKTRLALAIRCSGISQAYKSTEVAKRCGKRKKNLNFALKTQNISKNILLRMSFCKRTITASCICSMSIVQVLSLTQSNLAVTNQQQELHPKRKNTFISM